MKTKRKPRWVVKVTLISVSVSMAFTFASSKALGSVGYVMAFVVLAVFILLGIIFDVIGVSVTAASIAPFHSMAAHKQPGASESIRLIRNAEKVASICNDVVGDISGIVSGSTAAIIVARLANDMSVPNVILQLGISGLVTGLTVGGKALGKAMAIDNSTAIVLKVGRIVHFKNSLFRKK